MMTLSPFDAQDHTRSSSRESGLNEGWTFRSVRNLGTVEETASEPELRVPMMIDVRSCDDRTVETSESAQVTNDLIYHNSLRGGGKLNIHIRIGCYLDGTSIVLELRGCASILKDETDFLAVMVRRSVPNLSFCRSTRGS